MSFSAGFAAGLAVGKKKWGNGAVVDDWQPPDWWIPVPEPEPYDVYILIQVENAGKKFTLRLGDQRDDAGMGTVHYDWGDGTEEIYTYGPDPSHTYTETGQYLIHVTGDENAYFLRYWNFNDSNNGYRDIVGLIIKTGSEIAFRTDYWDANNRAYDNLFTAKSFKHIKIKHPKGVPAEKKADYFAQCHNLQKIELAKKISGNLQNRLFVNCYALKNLNQFIDCDNITGIGEFAFGYCYRLDDVDFPSCTEVGKDAFYQCHNLIRAEMPNCTHIDDSAFGLCHNLQEIDVANNCTFGTNCFQNCYSLYPRPDGSVN